MNKKFDFNISYSLISLFKGCERQFYYSCIAKLKPTDFVTDVYGIAGKLVHTFIEDYYTQYKNKEITLDEIRDKFDKIWENKNLHTKVGFFNTYLKKEQYWNAIVNGLNKKYNITKFEELIEFNDVYKIKGLIDAVVDNGDIIVDWKTNSSIDVRQKEQLKFYAYLYYRKYKKLPKKFVLEYLKINKKLEASFDKNDILDVRDMINDFIKKIHSKKKFSDWSINKNNCVFCPYKTKCEQDFIDQEEEKFILEIKNGTIYIRNPLTELFRKVLDKHLSYEIDNKYFVIQACKAKGFEWDGIVRHFKNNKLSIGFYHFLLRAINDYSKATNKLCPIEIIDRRKPEDINYELELKNKSIKLRNYQKEAVDIMLRSKIGILGLATSAGKTLISAEIIRRKGLNTLFVIDNKTLLSQTKKEYEDYFDSPVGTITEGEINLKPNKFNRTITVSTIQTIVSRLKKKDKKMINYLKTIQMVIYDECHQSKSKSYQMLHKKLLNCHYYIGLTGTPGNDKKEFLDLQAITGDVVYEIKAKDLIEFNYIMKPNIYFIEYKFGQYLVGTYQETFEQIIDNKNRNSQVLKVLENNKNKLTLIIVSRIKHGQIIEKMLCDNGYETFFIRGEISNKKRDEILNEARNGHSRILIGTSTIVSKGLNIKNLQVLINMTANVSDVQTIQSLGRLLRKQDGKTEANYYDFYDDIPYMKEHSLARIKQFEKEGHKINFISL